MSRRRGITGASGGASGDGFKMEVTLTAENQTFTMPFVAGSLYDCTIYWGDGTSVAHNTTDTVSKTYTGAIGTKFVIEIQGRADRLNFNNGGSKLMVTKILSWGGTDFEGFSVTMFRAFYGCSNLTELAEGGIKERLAITNFQGCFENCTKLTAIPSGLFDNNVSVTTFWSCFQNCTALTTLPSGLFANNASVTTFYACFRDCNKLTMRSDIFNFANFLNKSMNWQYFLIRHSFTGTQGAAPAIWNADYGTGTPALAPTPPFDGAGNSTTSLSNYNDIPADWKTFSFDF